MTDPSPTVYGVTLRSSVTWDNHWWTVRMIGPRNVLLEHDWRPPVSVPLTQVARAA